MDEAENSDLLVIGLDSSFDAAMTFVQSTLQNINAGSAKLHRWKSTSFG